MRSDRETAKAIARLQALIDEGRNSPPSDRTIE